MCKSKYTIPQGAALSSIHQNFCQDCNATQVLQALLPPNNIVKPYLLSEFSSISNHNLTNHNLKIGLPETFPSILPFISVLETDTHQLANAS